MEDFDVPDSRMTWWVYTPPRLSSYLVTNCTRPLQCYAEEYHEIATSETII